MSKPHNLAMATAAGDAFTARLALLPAVQRCLTLLENENGANHELSAEVRKLLEQIKVLRTDLVGMECLKTPRSEQEQLLQTMQQVIIEKKALLEKFNIQSQANPNSKTESK